VGYPRDPTIFSGRPSDSPSIVRPLTAYVRLSVRLRVRFWTCCISRMRGLERNSTRRRWRFPDH